MEKNRNLDEIIDLLSMILDPKIIEDGKKVVNEVKENVGDIVESVVENGKNIVNDVKENVGEIVGNVVNDVKENVGEIVENVGDIVESIVENGKNIINDVKENVGEIIESVVEIRSLDNIIEKLKYTYKDGISKYELEKIRTGIITSIFEKLDKIGFNENQQMLIKKYLEEQINEKIAILEKQINEGKQLQQKEIEEQNKKISLIEESFNVLQNYLKDHKVKLMDEKKKETDLLTQELKKFEENITNVDKKEYERKFGRNNTIQIKRSNKQLNNKYLNESIKILTNPSLSNIKKRNLILELQRKYYY